MWPSLAVADYAVLSVIALSMMTGLIRGFVRELIALVVWGLALWLALTYSHQLSPYLPAAVHDPKLRQGLAFAAIVLLTVLAGAVVNALLSLVLRRSGLSLVDRSLGMGFGLLRGVFLVSLVLLGLSLVSFPLESLSQGSWICPKFNGLVTWMQGYAPKLLDQVKHFDLPR